MQRFSLFSLLRGGFTGQLHWQPQWRSPDPKPAYNVVIIGEAAMGSPPRSI